MGFSFFLLSSSSIPDSILAAFVCIASAEEAREREKGEREKIFFFRLAAVVFSEVGNQRSRKPRKKGFLCFFRIAFSSFTRKAEENILKKHS